MIALVTGTLVSNWYQANPCVKFIQSPKSTYSAVFCARDIPPNSKITEDQLEIRYLPESTLPANACDCIYVPIGRTLPYLKSKGEYISLKEFRIVRPLLE